MSSDQSLLLPTSPPNFQAIAGVNTSRAGVSRWHAACAVDYRRETAHQRQLLVSRATYATQLSQPRYVTLEVRIRVPRKSRLK